MTLSGYVRASTPIQLNFQSNYRTPTGSYVMSVSKYSAISATTEFTKFKVTFTVPDNEAKGPDSWFDVMLGASDLPGDIWIEFAKWKLEEGDFATEFVPRPIGEELALCQRYYCKLPLMDTATIVPEGASFTKKFPVTMRDVPKITHDIRDDNFTTVGAGLPNGTWGLQIRGKSVITKTGTIAVGNEARQDFVTFWIYGASFGGTSNGFGNSLVAKGLYITADAEL